MATIKDILSLINPEHRVMFVGWEFDFRDCDWPSVLEFRMKSQKIIDNEMVIELEEWEDVTWSAETLKDIFDNFAKNVNKIKFIFNDVEVVPSMGDVGHSDKITHINFEPK